MNMEIKLRAWDKVNKIMSLGYTMDWFLGINRNDMLFKNDESLPLKDFVFFIRDFELMLYTGVPDANGTEICQGDILKRTISVPGEDPVITYDKVERHPGCFVTVKIGDKNDKGTYLANWHLHKIEIIGNIYENRDLLNSR